MSLAAAYLDSLRAREPGAEPPDQAELETQLRPLYETGRAAHGFEIEAATFARYLGARSTPETLPRLAAEDLYLACACVEGVPEAVELFRRRFEPEIRLALSKMPDALEIADDISQQIFTQLLVAQEGRPPGIASYRGRGGLFSWLRVVTVRRAQRELTKRRGHLPLADEQILASMGDEPDLAYMKELYRQAFRDAFREALAELDDGARTLLRHHYVHGLSIDKLSALHEVHRATAARRLARSREDLLQGTRRRLLHALRVSSDELDSIMRLIASRIDASMGALMTSSTD